MKTIDDLCKLPDGSFKKFIEKKENFLKSLEIERKERIRKFQLQKSTGKVPEDASKQTKEIPSFFY